MSKLTNNEKSQIQECLKQYVSKYPSQNKAAQSLTGISSATLSKASGRIFRTTCGATSPHSWGQRPAMTGRWLRQRPFRK